MYLIHLFCEYSIIKQRMFYFLFWGFVKCFITVEPHQFELNYLEYPVISNSKPFSLDFSFSHLLSAVLNPHHFELFFVSAKSSK